MPTLKTTFRQTVYLALLSGILFTSFSCSSPNNSKPHVTLLAASSLTKAIKEISAAWTRDTHTEIDLGFAASNTLCMQLLSGANADIFISANPLWTKELEQAGLVQSKIDFLRNRLVLVTPLSNPAKITSPTDLLSDTTRNIAIAGQHVPAGTYAEQALTHAGIWEAVQEKIVRGNNARSVLTFVERGEVDAGIVYLSDTTSTNEQITQIAELSGHEPIVYSLVLMVNASDSGRRLFEELASGQFETTFAKHSFSAAGIPDSTR